MRWFMMVLVLTLGSITAPLATPTATAQIGPTWEMAALKRMTETAALGATSDQGKAAAAQKKIDAYNAYTRTTTTYNLLKYRIRMDRPLEANTIETYIAQAAGFQYEADNRNQQGEQKDALGDAHWSLGNSEYMAARYEEACFWFDKCYTDYPAASAKFDGALYYYRLAMDQCAGADAIMAMYALP